MTSKTPPTKQQSFRVAATLALVGIAAGCASFNANSSDWRPATSVGLDSPAGLAVENQILFISAGARLWKVDLATQQIRTIRTPKPFYGNDLALDHQGGLLATQIWGLVRVSLADGHVVPIRSPADPPIDPTGNPDHVGGGAIGEALAIDPVGRIHLIDCDNPREVILKGLAPSVAGRPTSEVDRRNCLRSVALDASGVIYMADGFESPEDAKIEGIDPTTGVRKTIIGQETPVVVDPTVGGGPWHILSPSALTWDRSNGLLFLDPINGRVLRLDLGTGVVRALCGSTKGDSGDGGPAVRARLNNPSALAVDEDGNIFVADFVANRIRRIDRRTGLISTVAGNGKPTRKAIL